VPSPVTVDHAEVDGVAGTWLGVYHAATPGTAFGHNATSYLREDAPQPDVYPRILPDFGGMSWVEGGYLHGIPELLTEVSRSSASYDLHLKLDLYEAAKIPEYMVILLHEQEIRWHRLVDDRYAQMPPDADGVWRYLLTAISA
jgi:Uma2 family endonuclease